MSADIHHALLEVRGVNVLDAYRRIIDICPDAQNERDMEQAEALMDALKAIRSVELSLGIVESYLEKAEAAEEPAK